jgi:hypothetical protein
LKSEQLDEILHLLIKGLNLLEIEFRKLFTEKLNQEIRIKFLNTLKMFTYLIVEFTNFIEKKIAKENTDIDLLSTTTTGTNNKVYKLKQFKKLKFQQL